jgi:hypothetical protein
VVHGAAEAYQFDWSHGHFVIGGEEHIVKAAFLWLCHSRAFFLPAYPRESQETVFDARAFTVGRLLTGYRGRGPSRGRRRSWRPIG